MENKKNSLITIKVQKWEDMILLAGKLKSRIYRGQSDICWGLVPSIERFCNHLDSSIPLRFVEQRIIAEFKRASHLYLSNVPEKDNWIEWISLIQHYGGPTRLLDFTKSIYVAIFFAFEKLSEKDVAVWAINGNCILGKLTKMGILNKDEYFQYENSEMVFNNNFTNSIKGTAVGSARPYYLNERIHRQQGTFLFSLNMEHTFEENLFGMLNIDKDSDEVINLNADSIINDSHVNKKIQKSPIIKIVLDRSIQKDALIDLYNMNITSCTLFPGLDGYTRSLTHEIYRTLS